MVVCVWLFGCLLPACVYSWTCVDACRCSIRPYMEIEPVAFRETYRLTPSQFEYLLSRVKSRMPQSKLRKITLRRLLLAFLRLIASGWRLKVGVGRSAGLCASLVNFASHTQLFPAYRKSGTTMACPLPPAARTFPFSLLRLQARWTTFASRRTWRQRLHGGAAGPLFFVGVCVPQTAHTFLSR